VAGVLIGGLAASLVGRPRLTRDVDVFVVELCVCILRGASDKDIPFEVHLFAFGASHLGSGRMSPPRFLRALPSVGNPLMVSQDLASARRSS
jgi:hypothetical protein